MLEKLEEIKQIVADAWDNTYSSNISLDTPEIKIWSGEAFDVYYDNEIYVIAEDPYKIAEMVYDNDLKPLVLVCNNGSNPISSISDGSTGHDTIFIRINIATSLKENNIMMNLKRGEIILAKDVTIYKDQNFTQIKSFKSDIVFAMPLERPAILIEDEVPRYTNQVDDTHVRSVLEKVFKLGTHYHCLILNEFGCNDKLNNPINVITDIINELTDIYNIPCVTICIKTSEQEKIVNPFDDFDNPVFQNFSAMIQR